MRGDGEENDGEGDVPEADTRADERKMNEENDREAGVRMKVENMEDANVKSGRG